jgi:hypothetical protein
MAQDRVRWRDVVNCVLNLCWPSVQPSTSQVELCCIEPDLCIFTRFTKLVSSVSKIWTCFYKLFWKLLLIIRIGYIHLINAGSICNTWARKCDLRCGWPSRSTCATHSCVFTVCCWCRCGNYSTYWILVNVAQIVTVSCIELSFHFFRFVPHTVLRSLRRERGLVVSLVTMNQVRQKDKKVT